MNSDFKKTKDDEVVTRGILKKELEQELSPIKIELKELSISMDKRFDIVMKELGAIRQHLMHMDSTMSSYRHGAVLMERDIDNLDERVLKLELKGRGAIA